MVSANHLLKFLMEKASMWLLAFLVKILQDIAQKSSKYFFKNNTTTELLHEYLPELHGGGVE